MKNLLAIRVITIAFFFLFVNKLTDVLIAPLSIMTSILHELGHSVGAIISGGEVFGYTLAPDCPCLYACTRGGIPFIILLGGNVFSISAAFLFVYVGRILSKIQKYIVPTFIFLSFLMFVTVKLIDNPDILSNTQVGIYALIFLIFILLRSGWAGAFLIFFGFLNLILIVKDTMTGGILSDISRYYRLIPFILPFIWASFWLGTVGYISFLLLIQITKTKVHWIKGRSIINNIDFEKILLFLSILPNLVGFAFDQLFEFLVIELTAIYDGIRRFFSI